MDFFRNLNLKEKLRFLGNLKDKTRLVQIIMFGMLITIIVLVVIYVRNKLTLKSRDCDYLEKDYPNFPTLSSVPAGDDSTYGYNLRDYYIKSAYNCCNPGSMVNSFVDTCALKNAIKQGARCLDFAIYSVNNNPVIASSSGNSYDVKDTYNSVPFKSAMEVVNNFAFSGSTCPNPNDPLILHFRILTNNQKIMPTMANTIFNTLERRLLGKAYSYENHGENLGADPIQKFLGKVIISVDKSNKIFENTPLDEYVNICSGSPFMRCLREKDVKYTHDMQELINFNKKNMSIVLPNVGEDTENPSAAFSMQCGCQMIAMSYQFKSGNLTHYNDKFSQAGHAFVLKPADLRYVPQKINVPNPPPMTHSTQPWQNKTDYYNFTI